MEVLEKLYVFVVMWSIGALLELEDRDKLQEFMTNNEEFTLNLPALTPGSEERIFDYYVNNEGEKLNIILHFHNLFMALKKSNEKKNIAAGGSGLPLCVTFSFLVRGAVPP